MLSDAEALVMESIVAEALQGMTPEELEDLARNRGEDDLSGLSVEEVIAKALDTWVPAGDARMRRETLADEAAYKLRKAGLIVEGK